MRKFIATMTAASMLSITSVSAVLANGGPVQVVVSLKDQHMTVYRGLTTIMSSNISSGKKNHDTPTGIFSVLQKNRHHRSNIYSNAPMPFMQRLTWSGIALHASNSVPRYPASHGCIRMPHKFAGKLFKMGTFGAHVIIEDDPKPPSRITHPTLFKPVFSWSQSKEYDAWVNQHISRQNLGFKETDHRHPARIFITRHTQKAATKDIQRLLNELGFGAGSVDGVMGPTTRKAIGDFRSSMGLSNDGKLTDEVSNALYRIAGESKPANGRLLVRKHQRTVFETEIHISDPEKPLGSHLLTTYNFDKKASDTQWTAFTLRDRVQKNVSLKSGIQIDRSTQRFSVRRTLDRIQMSKHDREQISRMLSPGSSITISDNGMSIETGAKGTDFIVLTDPKEGSPNVSAGLAKIAG